MSGFLGSVVGAIGTAQGLANLLGGAPPVILGPVQFSGIETPAHIPFGGRQRLAVHRLPGGARVIDAMGRDDADLVWTGYLEGPTAADRAIQIDQLRVSGAAVPLSWDSLSFTVVVAEFIPDFHRTNWIPYTIRCTVLMDNAAAFAAPPTSLLSQLSADFNSAFSAVMPALTTVESAITVAQSAVLAGGALVKGSQPFVAAIAAVGSAGGVISAATTAANSALSSVAGGVSSVSGILGTTDPISAIGALTGFTSAAGNLQSLVTTGGYIGRVLTNLTNASA